jgi:sterol 14-demethylase
MCRVRDAARAEIGRIFSKVIRERRERGVANAEQDMLQAFMDAEYKDGSRTTDDQITGLLLGTLFAGQHTSSITTTWTILNILHSANIYPRVMQELVRYSSRGDRSRIHFTYYRCSDCSRLC